MSCAKNTSSRALRWLLLGKIWRQSPLLYSNLLAIPFRPYAFPMLTPPFSHVIFLMPAFLSLLTLLAGCSAVYKTTFMDSK